MSTVNSVPFLEAFDDVSRGNKRVPLKELGDNGLLPVVDQGKSAIAGYVNDQTLAVSTAGPIIVFGDHTRAVKYVDFPFAMGADGTKLLKARPGFDSRYLYYALRAIDLSNAGYSRHFKFLKQTRVPRFELDQQCRIASILDEADAIRAKRRAQIAHLDGLPQALFHQMFNAVTETQPLRDLLTETRYGTSNKSSEHGTPTLRIPNVANGSLDLRDMKKVRVSEGEFAQLQLLEGDILFVRSNGNPENTGRCAVFDREAVRAAGLDPDKMIYASYLIRARLSQVSPTYVCAFMESPEGRRQLRDRSNTSAGQYNLNSTNLGTVKIPIVPAEHQRDFANKVTAVKEERDRATRALEADNELFAALQHRAFCGKL